MSIPQGLPLPAISELGSMTARHERRLRFYWAGSNSAHNDIVDLDLQAWGYIRRDEEKHYRASVFVTEAGVAVLASYRAMRQSRASCHHSMGARLAEFLRENERLAWENIEFKSFRPPVDQVDSKDASDFVRFDIVRPDVFSIHPTHDITKTAPQIHEIKVSRADFLADLAKPAKRAAYQRLAGAVYYVAAAGLLKTDEIPEGCGLMEERSPGVFVRTKAVRARRVAVDPLTLLNLVLKSNRGNAMPASPPVSAG